MSSQHGVSVTVSSPGGSGTSPKAASRDRILEAARTLFAERGFASCRVADVARGARMSAGNVYWLFDSKEAILRAILAEGFGNVEAMAAEVADAYGPARRKLDLLVDRTLAFYDANGPFVVILGGLLAGCREAPGEIIEILRRVRGHDADRADPAPTIRLAFDPAEPHRQFSLFERNAGTRRTAERCHHARQCDTDGGDAEQRPAAKIKRPHEPQFGSFPQAPNGQWQWPQFDTT